MAVRQRSDPSGALARVQAGFKGGFTGVIEALKRRQELQDAIKKLLAQEQIDERTPERQVERIGLDAAKRAGREAQPPGGFSRAEREQPQALERAFKPVREERMRGALQRFGLIKPASEGLTPEKLREILTGGVSGGAPGADVTGGVAGEAGAFGVTGLTLDPGTGSVKISLGETPAGKEARETRTQVGKDLAKRRRETQEGFQKTVGLFSNFVSQFKLKLASQPGGKGGLPQGAAGKVGAFFKIDKFAPVEAIPGQRRETALALNSVLTGQQRVIRGVVDMILSTLPSDFDSEACAAQKLSQSLRNDFRLIKASNIGVLNKDILEGFNTSPITAKQLRAGEFPVDRDDGVRLQEFLLRNVTMTEDETRIVDILVRQVLDSPMAKRETLLPEGVTSFQEGGAAIPTGRSTFRLIEELP